jgi:nucleotide-binding universal stress UspA family protein
VPQDQAVDVWVDAPRVRETLERWKLLGADSPRSAVHERLSLRVAKLNVRGSDPLQTIVDHLEQRSYDLVVLATEGRTGLPRWLKPSLAENIARRANTMTLFVPGGSHGFVDPDRGTIELRRILLPVDHAPDPASAVTYAARAAVMSHRTPVEIDLLRVGPMDESWPALQTPELQSCRWNRLHREGDVVEQILETAERQSADLVVMATSGAKGILGALRGSVTERVLRQTRCPLLAVPARVE